MHTYQLYIKLDKTIKLQIGKLGKFTFPKGDYIYTGSAKKNINTRIKRHFSKNKKIIGILIIYWKTNMSKSQNF